MAVLWYDNAMNPDPQASEWLDIERIYCFDWDGFSDQDWHSLNEIYLGLPYYMGSDEGFHRWFSRLDDQHNGYLWESVEPPGLQIAGALKQSDWLEWDSLFQKETAALPSRSLS